MEENAASLHLQYESSLTFVWKVFRGNPVLHCYFYVGQKVIVSLQQSFLYSLCPISLPASLCIIPWYDKLLVLNSCKHSRISSTFSHCGLKFHIVKVFCFVLFRFILNTYVSVSQGSNIQTTTDLVILQIPIQYLQLGPECLSLQQAPRWCCKNGLRTTD